jgi:hypothetical protein
LGEYINAFWFWESILMPVGFGFMSKITSCEMKGEKFLKLRKQFAKTFYENGREKMI